MQNVIALNEDTVLKYDSRVKFQINKNCVEDYLSAAQYVNSSSIDLVSVQHEFGLYGGTGGEFILHFFKKVKKPLIVTLHAVSNSFNPELERVFASLIEYCQSFVVMSRRAREILEDYGVSRKNIKIIRHGCPDLPFIESDAVKPSLGLGNDAIIISTFGLMNHYKGIEYVICALPALIEQNSKLIYLIIGETHPYVQKSKGEVYREELTELVNRLNLEKHVKFVNKYLSKSELLNYLQASDIYITPYISPNHASSGALAYAMGAGKAIISTPYMYAKEMLSNGRGLFCKFMDSASIVSTVGTLLDQKVIRKYEKSAYQYSRRFTWPNVAKHYISLFKHYVA